jgi:early B-cell factor
LILKKEFPADEYSRTQSSSVSPRGYCNSSASTPHSTGGSGGYGTAINGYGPPISGISSPVPSANVFNSTSSESFLLKISRLTKIFSTLSVYYR